MRLSIVVHLTGMLVNVFSPAFLAPALVSAWYREWRDVEAFLIGFGATFVVGALMRRASGTVARDVERLRRIEGLAIVAATWMLVAHFAAIPYMIAGLGFVDALFESMSGVTTTGATILKDFGILGRGMFFWRALTQWLGGIAVIAVFVAVLPRLGIGGRELFFAEASAASDKKLTPQLRDTAIAICKVYIVLTLLQILALSIAGMTLYDAVCHAFATMAAGSFSPHPLSVGGYQNAAAEWIIIVFMFIAGASFSLQYRALGGGRRALISDEELRAYSGVVLVASALLVFFLTRDGMAVGDAVRHGLFQVVSIVTTTGSASVDFALWDDQAKMVLFLMMFIGGCAGSAAGGPKVVRHILMARLTLRELKRTLHPRAVLPVKLGGRVVPEHILRDVQVFMLFYLLAYAVGVAIVVMLGADLITGITGTIACLGNIGPGFGAVGPTGSFGDLHPVSKVVLTLEMWIGRLEVLTVLVFFRLEAWRSVRWSGA